MTDQKVSTVRWVRVLDYPLYSLSENGEITNNDTGYALKAHANRSGLMQVNLSKQGVRRTFNVHRLVAKHFLAGYSDEYGVEFIDGDKNNFKLSNLRQSKKKTRKH